MARPFSVIAPVERGRIGLNVEDVELTTGASSPVPSAWCGRSWLKHSRRDRTWLAAKRSDSRTLVRSGDLANWKP